MGGTTSCLERESADAQKKASSLDNSLLRRTNALEEFRKTTGRLTIRASLKNGNLPHVH